MKAPFTGIKVIECAEMVSGPQCCRLLANMGAEVIKVENTPDGDKARYNGPFPGDIPHLEKSGLFLYLNMGKKSVALNLEKDSDKKIFLELLNTADVLVENYPYNEKKRLGLVPGNLLRINPHLIFISISPFGSSGSRKRFKGNDLIGCHSSGLAYFTPEGNFDREKCPPLKPGGRQADFITGTAAACAAVYGLFYREATGRGIFLDISQQEAVIATIGRILTNFFFGQTFFGRRAREVVAAPPLPCKDGHVVMHVVEKPHFDSMVEVMGNPAWGQDPLYQDFLSRARNWDKLEPLLIEWASKYSKQEIYHAMQKKHVAFAPVNTMAEVMKSEQLKANKFFIEIEHPESGRNIYPGAPFKLSETPWQVKGPAPLLGQYNEEVLGSRLSRPREAVTQKAAHNTNRLPLEGIRIIDFTWMVIGPLATLWTAAMGAEIIKIESRQRPDFFRRQSVSAYGRQTKIYKKGDLALDMSSNFFALNYGKKSCTLNMAQPYSRELLKKLISISDAVVDNFGFGVMERLGFDYESLKKIKPDIIVLSMSGAGKAGPERDYIFYAPNIHACSGLAAITGYKDGRIVPPGAFLGDQIAAIHAQFALLSALYHRKNSGEGQYIDFSILEACVTTLPESFMDYVFNGHIRGPQGNEDDRVAPHGCYRCNGDDRWIALAVETEQEWESFCRLMGNPAWVKKDKFKDNCSRRANQEELDINIQSWTKSFDAAELMEKLQKAGIPAALSCTIEDLLKDDHLKQRGFLIDVEHPALGISPLASLPWRMSPNLKPNLRPSPLIGEHNEYVFGELLGLSGEEIARLEQEKVIY